MRRWWFLLVFAVTSIAVASDESVISVVQPLETSGAGKIVTWFSAGLGPMRTMCAWLTTTRFEVSG